MAECEHKAGFFDTLFGASSRNPAAAEPAPAPTPAAAQERRVAVAQQARTSERKPSFAATTTYLGEEAPQSTDELDAESRRREISHKKIMKRRALHSPALPHLPHFALAKLACVRYKRGGGAWVCRRHDHVS